MTFHYSHLSQPPTDPLPYRSRPSHRLTSLVPPSYRPFVTTDGGAPGLSCLTLVSLDAEYVANGLEYVYST